MRLSCSFTLSPDQHEADAFAVQTLKAWQLAEQGRGDSAEVQRQRRNAFHRQIYLSGLFLHQLAPKLPALLAEALGERVSAQTLTALAEGAGVSLDSQSGLSEPQWQKLTALMATAPAPAPNPEPGFDPAPLLAAMEALGQAPALGDGNAEVLMALASEMEALKEGQDTALAQLSALKRQLAEQDRPVTAPAEAGALSSQLDKARKVKEKGLW
ncbi:plasmid partitioning/stability family protein [Ferrimonas balearica]|uniref:plasmid partitioning/stability family protein n=1 Tax=Ferrimonas balearica TaxID=44012 RepID=UPI001C9A0C7C|nr:plasmid partitioning/stability family protein [Ferrimonas balearica]MBY5990631.1 plasmid partitioning/stability family protein [Ferrimonas balearica]